MTQQQTTTDWMSANERIAKAEAAAIRYGYPARALRAVGVTGTNGKTTTVHLLRALLDTPDACCASIGTLGVLVGREGRVVPGGAGLTTPGPDELQRVLRELVDMGVRQVVMEVSSHALDQHRAHGVHFAAAVYTNFTRDHLDYHQTMETYFAAKAKLIASLADDGVVVVNADDPAWHALPPAPRRVTFGVTAGDVRAEGVRYDERGSTWTLVTPQGSAPVHLPLIGDFNVANALGAAASALALGHSLDDVTQRLSAVPQVPGRLEIIASVPTVLRDYAHTPDALERALGAVRPFARGRLILVFGAGGDRDPGKRALMGGIAERMADVAVVTSDNPRTESPAAIIDAIEAGMPARRHVRIEDRRAAIAYAVRIAQPTDVVLLAGKGHETYQVIGTEKHPFDEQRIVYELIQALAQESAQTSGHTAPSGHAHE
jgi:UDP-N-acetylmuramoyl-L-alanyl-D-glutamate--2,6-diaminopimelate ligase